MTGGCNYRPVAGFSILKGTANGTMWTDHDQPRRCQGRRRTAGAVLALSATLVLLGVLPCASATARTINGRADHAALGAYRTYLHALVRSEVAAARRDHRFVSHVEGVCRGGLTRAQISRIGVAQLRSFGLELGGDLAIRYNSQALRPFNRLAASLSSLTWASQSAVATVMRFIYAERAVLRLRTTNLCLDFLQLNDHPRRTPSATARFGRRYLRVATAAQRRNRELLELFQRYQTRTDGGLIDDINAYLGQYATAATHTQSQSATEIRRALRLTG